MKTKKKTESKESKIKRLNTEIERLKLELSTQSKEVVIMYYGTNEEDYFVYPDFCKNAEPDINFCDRCENNRNVKLSDGRFVITNGVYCVKKTIDEWDYKDSKNE